MKQEGHQNRAHALLSASGASRWLNCTASPRLEEHYENTTSAYAEEGTLAHEISELLLRNAIGAIDPVEAIQKGNDLEKHAMYSSEMPDEVQKYVDFVLETLNAAKSITPEAKLLIEERVDLTDFIEDGFGTNDAIILSDKVLDVIDLKYGKGVRVNAENNSQLMLYGLGALNKHLLSYDIETIRLNIVQPRLDHIDTWEISAKELLEWGETIVKPKAVEAYKGGTEPKPGDWCKFCKAKARCSALANKNMQDVKMEFNDSPEVLKDSKELTDEQLTYIFQVSGAIKDWLSSIESYMLKEAVSGKNWPNLKLVEGRSQRKWVDETSVEEKLLKEGYQADQIFISKLGGITQIEKLIGKKNFETVVGEFVTKPQGSPTLVDVSDKRPPYNFAATANDFIDEDDLL